MLFKKIGVRGRFLSTHKKLVKRWWLTVRVSNWKTKGTLATLLLAPGSLTSIMALSTLWAPLVKKMESTKWKKVENIG